MLRLLPILLLLVTLDRARSEDDHPDTRPRIVIETDAGGDPDDEQSLVRFLVYANEFDVEGIIANREVARTPENKNPVRDGLGIVRAMIKAYGECWPNLKIHAQGFPSPDDLLARAVAGYAGVDDGVNLIIRAVDKPDPRPLWFSNWGTDQGSAESCLKRALDRVLKERGPEGYAAFKKKIRLSSADRFGDHTTKIEPPFPIWVNTSAPPMDGVRWYHRFSQLTARAGGFDIERDVRTNHGPLGAMYPTNTTHPQKEGDTMMFLYLLPTGMNDPNELTWGSWAGRHGLNPEYAGKPYYWANQLDRWNGKTNRDNTLLRWANDLQNDFKARMNWCVQSEYSKANHAPVAVLNGDRGKRVLHLDAKSGDVVSLNSRGSFDDGREDYGSTWSVYPEAGTYPGEIKLDRTTGSHSTFTAPVVTEPQTVHVILEVKDHGTPNMVAYRRAVITIRP